MHRTSVAKLRRSLRSGVLAIAIVLASSGCQGFKQATEDSQQTRAAIKSQLGVDSSVGFRMINGRLMVTVRLKSVPRGDAAEIKSKVDSIVESEFHQKVDRVDVAF
jgi:hypothetical protein